MRLRDILREHMSLQDAINVWKAVGVDPTLMNPAQLKTAHRALVMKHHPDRGGDVAKTQEINSAYDTLRSAKGAGKPPATDPLADEPEQDEDTSWSFAGYSGGAHDRAYIRRKDYTDMNFIKKRMWELSGKSRQEWSIQGFDGYFFRHSVTVYGSPAIFDEMARAMITWQTRGGNSYPCRAVFVQKRHERDLYLIWADGVSYAKNPIRFEHDSFNMNASNDQSFTRRLPGILDDLKDQRDGS